MRNSTNCEEGHVVHNYTQSWVGMQNGSNLKQNAAAKHVLMRSGGTYNVRVLSEYVYTFRHFRHLDFDTSTRYFRHLNFDSSTLRHPIFDTPISTTQIFRHPKFFDTSTVSTPFFDTQIFRHPKFFNTIFDTPIETLRHPKFSTPHA